MALTPEEEEEKDALRTQGFEDWTRRDFQVFVKACERYGRYALRSLSKRGVCGGDVRADASSVPLTQARPMRQERPPRGQR